MSFVSSSPHRDEMARARKLYYREIEEGGIYQKIAQEILADGQALHPLQGDLPGRKKLYRL